MAANATNDIVADVLESGMGEDAATLAAYIKNSNPLFSKLVDTFYTFVPAARTLNVESRLTDMTREYQMCKQAATIFLMALGARGLAGPLYTVGNAGIFDTTQVGQLTAIGTFYRNLIAFGFMEKDFPGVTPYQASDVPIYDGPSWDSYLASDALHDAVSVFMGLRREEVGQANSSRPFGLQVLTGTLFFSSGFKVTITVPSPSTAVGYQDLKLTLEKWVPISTVTTGGVLGITGSTSNSNFWWFWIIAAIIVFLILK